MKEAIRLSPKQLKKNTENGRFCFQTKINNVSVERGM
jgi:hypothetical protein